MNIRMDELIKTIASALDMVEFELLGASTNHGKRIAALCASMGRYFKMDEDSLSALTTCAFLHDNALTEYILSERQGEKQESNMRLHCQYGQRNVEKLLLRIDTRDFILHHHERADGGGPFGKREGEYSLGAELIAIADMLDVRCHLQRVSSADLPILRKQIAGEAGRRFTARAVEAMLHVLDDDMLVSLSDEQIYKTTERAVPIWEVGIGDTVIFRIAEIVADIIDYKSIFTKKHTIQIANRAWLMSGYYNLNHEQRAQVYLAAAVHDIGKLNTPVGILEKPGKLDDEELRIIKEHIVSTHKLLKGITGFENICDWASNHHEKLDGTGYPVGKKAGELDFISRMMACTDIYQAVSEARPYHAGRSHKETMPILFNMAAKGFIDGDIVKDFDIVMAEYSNQDVPTPVYDRF